MSEFRIMAYNIEHMNKMFKQNAIKDDKKERAQQIASVIQIVNPDVLGICEAANAPEEHTHFIDKYLAGSGYQLAHGKSRGGQNLVFYYRAPFALISIDEGASFYDPWQEDIEQDGLKEVHKFERKPLEAVFEIGSGGPQVCLILVHTKSKGVFTVVDFHNFQKIALANRKRLAGQATKLRMRLDQLLQESESLPIIVMGDMNDGPGLDPFESIVGRSFVETVMGSVYNPDGIFHNALWWMSTARDTRKDLWTADFPDPIVTHFQGYQHRVWIDHILLSPNMLQENSMVRYVMDSGAIGERNHDSRAASDHFPVYCRIETD